GVEAAEWTGKDLWPPFNGVSFRSMLCDPGSPQLLSLFNDADTMFVPADSGAHGSVPFVDVFTEWYYAEGDVHTRKGEGEGQRVFASHVSFHQLFALAAAVETCHHFKNAKEQDGMQQVTIPVCVCHNIRQE